MPRTASKDQNTEALAAMADGVDVGAMTRADLAADIEKLTLSQIGRAWLSGEDTSPAANIGGPRSPYSQSVWVYACITALTANAGRVPIRISRGEATGTKNLWGLKYARHGAPHGRRVSTEKIALRAQEGEIVETGELYDLFDRPNPEQTWPQFIEATVNYLYQCGRVHWLFDEMVGRRLLTMYAIPGGQSTAIVDKSGQVAKLQGWTFTSPQGRRYPVTVEECITFMLFDPGDPHGGLSPREPAKLAIASDYNASMFNASMFANSCEPGTVLETEAPFNADQDEQIRTTWRQRHTGAVNARKLAVLWGGLQHKAVGQTLKEMVFPDGKKLDAIEICAVYRVPTAVAGFFGTSGDSSAYTDNELERFWQDTMAPLLNRIVEGINVHLVPRFAGGLEVWADLNDVPIYQKLRQARVDQAKKLWSMGVPFADLIEWADLGLPEQPHYATGLLPINLMPAGDVAAGNVIAPVDEGPESDNSDGLGQAAGVPGSRAVDLIDHPAMKAAVDRLWEAFARSWQPLAKRMGGMLTNHFGAQQRKLLKALRDADRDGTAGVPPVDSITGQRPVVQKIDESIIARVLLSVFGNRKDRIAFRARVSAFVADTNELGLRQSLAEAGFEGDALTDALARLQADPSITHAMSQETVRISSMIDDRTRTVLRRSLIDGLNEGEDIRHLADRVGEVMGGRRKQSMTVARNSVGQSLSRSRRDGRVGAGMTHETWIHSRGPGERRETHIAAEDTYAARPKPIGEPFVVGGVRLRYPRDFSAGVPEETINCQCMAIGKRIAAGQRATAIEMIREALARSFVTYDQMIALRQAEGGSEVEDAQEDTDKT